MTCPTFEALIDYADGRSQSVEHAGVEAHLAAGCDACTKALDWYGHFAAAAAGDGSFDPPTWVTERAIAAFADAKDAAANRGLRGIVARLRAALVFDSLSVGTAPDAMPARSSAMQCRQLLYSAVPFDVDLFVAEGSSPRLLAVTGQVLPIDGDDFDSVRGLVVTVEREGATIATAQTSEVGEFTIGNVVPGLYDLRLSSDDREIVISHTPLLLT